jgi:RHS repeat-associated protein
VIRLNSFFDQFIRRGVLAGLLALTTSAPIAQAQVLSTPKNISNNTGSSALPQIAVDSSGNINVVWMDNTPGNFDVFFSRSTDGGTTFSSPKNIGSTTLNNIGLGQQQIAVDSGGNINVVWHAFVGSAGNVDIFFTRSTDGGVTFSAPRDISNNLLFSTAQQIALDSGGNINVVWAGSSDIFLSRSTDGGVTFSTPKNLSNGTGFCSPCSQAVQIGVDPGGNINVVWRGFGSIGNIDTFFSRSTDGGATFSTPKRISNSTNVPAIGSTRIAVDSSGNINVVWEEDASLGSIFFSRSSDGGGTFSTPKKVSNNLTSSSLEQIAVDSSGSINVVWQELIPGLGQSDVFLSRSSDGGGTFSTPKNLSNDTRSSAPQVTLDSSGNINVVWQDSSPGNSDIFLSRSTDGGATFSTPKNFTNDVGSSLAPQMALDSKGNINVVWEDTTPGNFDIFFAGGSLPGPIGPRFAYVANSGSNSVSGFTIDSTTGVLTPVSGSPFPAGVGPRSVVVDPSGRFAYVPNLGIPPPANGSISAYTIDPTTGSLTPIFGSPFSIPTGTGANSLAIDPTDRFLYSILFAPNFGAVAGFAINPGSGALTPVPGSPFAITSVISPITFDPAGKFAYVQTFVSGSPGNPAQVLGFMIDASTGSLSPVPGSPFAAGVSNGLFPITVDRIGKFAYVPNSASGDVSAFAIDSTSGTLTQVPGSPFSAPLAISVTLDPTGPFTYVVDNSCGPGPDGFVTGFMIDASSGALAKISSFPAGFCPQSMTVDPTGHFAYVVDPTAILGYSVDAPTGLLTPVPGSPFAGGSNLESLTVDPSGKFIYVANMGSNNVLGYTINTTTGALTPLSGSPFSAGTNPQSVTIVAGSAPVSPPPAITSISPTSGTEGQAISNFTVTGSNFQPTSTISFSGTGIAVNSYSSRTSTQIVASVTIANAAPTELRDVGVVNPDGQQATLAAAFTVLVAPPVTHTLTVASTSPSTGVPITVSPSDNNAQRNGTTQFTRSYNDGTVVILTAAATVSGNNFSSWSGCDSTSTSTCTVTMNTDRTVTANYVTPAFPPPIAGTGSAGGPTSQQGQTSEPISTGNGNYYYQHIDFVVPARGMPLLFQRSYNALDNYSGPVGANWTHSYNILLAATGTGAVIKWGDGHGETFTVSGANYVPQPGVFSTLVKNADDTFVLTQKNQTNYAFSAAGKLTNVQDKNGNTILLTYDGSGNLSRITDAVDRSLSFSYDTSNRITQINDPNARTVSFQYNLTNDLVQATDPAAGITTFTYDSNHRIISITLPNSQVLLQNTYDGTGRVISQTGGRGFSATLAYGTPNPGDTTITDGRGNKTIHTYDSSLRIIRITDALGGTTSFTYDTNNDRTGVTNQNAKTTNFSYDSQGNITGITDPLTDSIAFTYDAKNNLLSATNAKVKTTSFSYDGNGNLTRIQDALGNATAFAYDGFGELSSKTDARGNATNFLYDSFGNLTRITDALSHSTTLTYDGIGRLTSITDPNGHTATARYDALSRLTKIADPLGNQTQFAYDAVGNLLKITDAKGSATSYAYDATNNLVSVTDALGHVTQYAYDPNNNRTTFTNAKGNATSYAYDALNRLNRIADPLSFATTYAYDSVGNALAVTDAKGQTNQFTYDALNRLLGISYADGKGVAYAYDANGNRTSMTDSHGTTAYSYDALDRLDSVTHPGAKVVTYAFDAVGNRKSLGYPDGKVLSYAYDPSNRLSQATDWLGRTTTYGYDAASNLTNTTYPNGTGIALAYDAANRLNKVVNSLKGLPPLTLAYALDAVGNRLALSVNGLTTQFGYDALDELASAQLGPLKSTWTYDVVGNRTKQTSPLGTVIYTYDAADRLLAANGSSFTYDADGNQISKTQTANGQPIIYAYDAANRLINVAGGVFTSSFSYDGDGNRISQSTRAGTYNYLNDVASALPVVLQESGPDGNISYAYGLGLISESTPTFDFFYHYDGLGSVIALTDATGKPRAGYIYDPWGNALLSIPDSVGTKNKFRFTGEALDPGTQLYYLRARYYDPSIGRFIGCDPLPGSVAFPLSRNRYQYSLSNPIRYTDPLGLSAIESNRTALTASALISCGKNCEMTIKILRDALASGARIIGRILSEEPNAQVSISPTTVGNTILNIVTSVLFSSDTIRILISAKDAKPVIQSQAGALDQNYSEGDLGLKVGVVCATSGPGFSLCFQRGREYVRTLIISSAREQGITSDRIVP